MPDTWKQHLPTGNNTEKQIYDNYKNGDGPYYNMTVASIYRYAEVYGVSY